VFHFALLSILMSELSLQEALKYVSQAGVLGFLIIVLYGGYKKWWVFGWLYRESEARTVKTEKERDDWRDIALHGSTIAEKTVDLFKRSRKE
jgi:hypothetical protein